MAHQIDPAIRHQLIDVIIRYATGIDERDWVRFRSCFTEDCQADYGEVGQWDNAEALTSFMEHVHADCGATMHRVGNHVIHAEGAGYTVRSYVDAIVMRGDNRKGFQMYGYYDDTFVLVGNEWRIARRRFLPTFTVRVVAHPET